MSTATIQPRLLTAEQAAAYLSVPKAILVRQAWGVVRLGVIKRYDRHALDAHLDRLGGLNTPSLRAGSSVGDQDDPEAALDRFLAP